uniref:Deoxyribonuclease TATDN1 n=2 Tax=Clastoptera arizonana TaxID=38151 RepID=A0A1B6E1P5_9HEMI
MAQRKIIDIGANLTDAMYNGVYNGSKKHEPDLIHVLNRAWAASIDKIIITAHLYSTVGCHPTRCDEFDKNSPDKYFQALYDLAASDKEKVVAIGECGLDYDRVQFCTKEVQQKYFEKQLKLSELLKLPLFLHCRNACSDLVKILTLNHCNFYGGVVHSFDGTAEELKVLLDLGYYIGINGCSLKTSDNLAVVKLIPRDKILIETDSPWCEVRPSHAGSCYIKSTFPAVKKEKWHSNNMVKSRNEPAMIVQVLEILSAVRGENMDSLCDIIYKNTEKLFFSTK